jgi:hypothetical protein
VRTPILAVSISHNPPGLWRLLHLFYQPAISMHH